MNASVEHIGLPWDRQMIKFANQEWGCNCGPVALAAVLRLGERETRTIFSKVGFMDKGYTNPTMMKQAIAEAGGCISKRQEFSYDKMRVPFPGIGLARIQWTGPWTKPGVPAQIAYRKTHWVAAWTFPLQTMIFDVNSGISTRDHWESNVVPWIVRECVPKADGGWFITHSWEVARGTNAG